MIQGVVLIFSGDGRKGGDDYTLHPIKRTPEPLLLPHLPPALSPRAQRSPCRKSCAAGATSVDLLLRRLSDALFFTPSFAAGWRSPPPTSRSFPCLFSLAVARRSWPSRASRLVGLCVSPTALAASLTPWSRSHALHLSLEPSHVTICVRELEIE
jgi:hypothetical protein